MDLKGRSEVTQLNVVYLAFTALDVLHNVPGNHPIQLCRPAHEIFLREVLLMPQALHHFSHEISVGAATSCSRLVAHGRYFAHESTALRAGCGATGRPRFRAHLRRFSPLGGFETIAW